jgi:hypothetical protein
MANSGRVTTGSIPRALQYGVDEWVQHFAKVYGNVGEQLFTKKDPNSKGFYESVTLAGMGQAARKGEGEAIQYDSIDQESNTRWAIHTYVKAARITMEAQDDNVYQDLLPMYAKEIAKSLVYTKDEQRAAIFNNAETSGQTGPDGKVLLATDHPLQAGGTSANRASVDADFSEDALEQMVILVDQFLNPDGLKSMYNSKYLVVPTQLKYEACRVAEGKDWQTNTANRNINALNQRGDIEDYKVWKRLSSASAWFITTDADDCLVEVSRKGLQRQEHNDPYTFDLVVSIYERYRMLFNDWRGIAGSFGP